MGKYGGGGDVKVEGNGMNDKWGGRENKKNIIQYFI